MAFSLASWNVERFRDGDWHATHDGQIGRQHMPVEGFREHDVVQTAMHLPKP